MYSSPPLSPLSPPAPSQRGYIPLLSRELPFRSTFSFFSLEERDGTEDYLELAATRSVSFADDPFSMSAESNRRLPRYRRFLGTVSSFSADTDIGQWIGFHCLRQYRVFRRFWSFL